MSHRQAVATTKSDDCDKVSDFIIRKTKRCSLLKRTDCSFKTKRVMYSPPLNKFEV